MALGLGSYGGKFDFPGSLANPAGRKMDIVACYRACIGTPKP